MRKFYLPLFFSFLFILESLFVQFLPESLIDGQYGILVPHFLLISVFFLTVYGNEKRGIIYGVIFGFLFDIIYTEILGVYLYLYPITTYIVSKIMKVLQVNIVIVSLASLVGVAVLEIAVYELNSLIGLTTLDFMTFLGWRLFPTLLLNAIFLLIAAYPLKRQFEKLAETD